MCLALIVADDLSGAADCGVVCVAAGLHTVVMFDGGTIPENIDVIVVDTDTRRWAPADAKAEVSRITTEYFRPELKLLYKKVDSTLRGNIGAETAAFLAAVRALPGRQHAVAIVAPAVPGNGRTTENGHQLLHGVPIEETDLWRRDGIEGRAHLPTMLASGGLRVRQITAKDMIDVPHLAAAMMATRDISDILVCDARTEADLRMIAQAGQALGPDAVWVGSSGLARYLPEAAGLRRDVSVPQMPGAAGGPVLFIIGSLSEVSREQAAYISQDPDVEILTVSPHLLREAAGTTGHSQLRTLLDRACATDRDVVLMIGTDDRTDIDEGLQLCNALAQFAAPYLGHFGGLFCTGGETARAFVQALGAARLRLVGEVETGVPISIIEWNPGAALQSFPIITKAGAFGTPGILLRCRDALRSGVMPAATSNHDLYQDSLL